MKNKLVLLASGGILFAAPIIAQQPARVKPVAHNHNTRMQTDEQEKSSTDKTDVELPEAETFLNLAADEMAKYHRAHKTYPTNWHLLNFDYAYPTYHMTDPDIRASAKDKNRWKPRGSHFTYVIVTASRNAFLIKALDEKEKPAYELRQKMAYPKLIGGAPGHEAAHK